MSSRVFSTDSSLLDEEEPTVSEPMDSSVFFPRMSRKIFRAYSRYCRKNVNCFAVMPIFVLGIIVFFSRLNLRNSRLEPIFFVSDAFTVLSSVVFSVNISPLILKRILKNPNAAHKMENFITRIPIQLSNVMMFFIICMYGFNLVARVVAGPCPDDVTLWETQTCTTDEDSVPSEIVTLLYITPLLFITAFENVSIAALICTWTIILGFVSFCIVYNNAWSQIWVLFNSLFFITLTFTVERDKRIAFLRLVELKEEKLKALSFLRNQHAAETSLTEQRRLAEIASVTAASEKSLRISETQQLRSLMGNVAHDLKTPLFSIEADIELLKLLFNTISPQAVQMALVALSQKCHGQNVDLDAATIFDSVWSTCRFMIAAINRGQDFAKASMNVALVPTQGELLIVTPTILAIPTLAVLIKIVPYPLMFNVPTGTIEVYKTITTATRCVRHLLSSDFVLVTQPLPSDLSDFIITDGHWLSENLLCLLSNAIKYSSSGEISLTIELVQRGAEPPGASVVRLDDDGIPMPISSTPSQIFTHHDAGSQDTMVLVIVEDEGVGVSPEVRLTLFQPFKQAQRLAGGTGRCEHISILSNYPLHYNSRGGE